MAALLAGLAGAFGPAATGWAAVPCGVNGVLSTAGATSSCTYTGEGEDSFTVPAGVDSLQVVAIGGKGGGPLGGQAGGFGARVSAQVPSQGGAVLHVEVAGNGGDSSFPGGSAFPTVGGVGGAGGGARGGSAILGAVAFGGGGGGGATDLRTAPLSAGLSPDPRLLVAGGGGGSAQSGTAGDGAGGAAGSAGAANGSGFGAGQPGTSTGGGSGGPGQPAQPGIVGPGGTGQDGGRGTGGAGGAGALQGDNIVSTGDGGGGGGGGYFGGGGGGGGGAQATADGGGGGGGSSFVSAGASDPVLAADTTGVPSMTISFPALRASDTTLTCTSVAVGQTSTCTAAVGDADSGTTVIPTGRVNFTSNSPGTFDAGSCLLASDGGRASCTVGYTPVRAASGSHEITASYDGDAAHGPSSAVAGVTIMTVTSTALLTSGNPAVAGDVVSYSVVVAPAPDRGTVLFVDNGTPIPNCGAVVLQPGSGAASCSLRYAATGSHNIQARYSGSGLYQESFSAQLIEVIRAAGSPPPTSTSTSVSSSQNPSQTGQTTTLTATVTPRPDDGTVQFYTTGGVAIQGCDDVPIQGQQASCKVMLVSAGSFDLRASYSGDAAFASSISPALSQAVKAPVTPTGQPIVINTGVSLTLTTSPTQANWDVSLALVDRIPPRPTGPNSPVQAASHMRRATAPAVRAKRGRRAHTIGIRTVNVRGGKKVTLSVKLNKLGRRLLAKRGALHVYLTVTLIFRGHRTVLETKKVTLR